MSDPIDPPVHAFFGGLGDVILRIYRTDAYTSLATPTERSVVVTASPNPFVSEIFKWHPRAENFVNVDLAPRFLKNRANGTEQRAAITEAIEFAGLPPERENMPRENGELEFFAIDSISSQHHIVFQPFAGESARNSPQAQCRKLIEIFGEFKVPVYICMRSFLRQNLKKGTLCHSTEQIDFELPDNVTVLDHTSVPATLKLTQDCSLFVGGDSALSHIAWSEEKPTIYLKKRIIGGAKGYLWGTARDDCKYFTFEDIDYESVRSSARASEAKWLKA